MPRIVRPLKPVPEDTAMQVARALKNMTSGFSRDGVYTLNDIQCRSIRSRAGRFNTLLPRRIRELSPKIREFEIELKDNKIRFTPGMRET